MRIKGSLVTLGAVLLFGGTAGPALAGAVGRDPSSNIPLNLNSLPRSCWSTPRGATCIEAGVRYLDHARARLGQGPYALPANFVSLSPAQQALILTNLDRVHYGLSPIPGLSSSLDRAAAGGVRAENDPAPSGSGWTGYTANWAGGYPNIVLAYGAWMYDDGQGSGNLDCTAAHPGGCWGHRHDVLWQFGPRGPLAMGAAAGRAGGAPGFAMLLEQERAGSHPAYVYRWSQAVQAGAGK